MGTLAAGVKRETRDQYVTAAGVGGMGGWVGRRKWLLKSEGKGDSSMWSEGNSPLISTLGESRRARLLEVQGQDMFPLSLIVECAAENGR